MLVNIGTYRVNTLSTSTLHKSTEHCFYKPFAQIKDSVLKSLYATKSEESYVFIFYAMTPIFSPSLTKTISMLCRSLSNAFLRQSDSTLLTLTIWQCILRGKPFSSRRPSVYISGWVTDPCQLQRSPGSVR